MFISQDTLTSGDEVGILRGLERDVAARGSEASFGANDAWAPQRVLEAAERT